MSPTSSPSSPCATASRPSSWPTRPAWSSGAPSPPRGVSPWRRMRESASRLMANSAVFRTVISMHEDTQYSLFSLIMAVAIGVVVGGVALTMVFWLLGGLFHLLFFLMRIGMIVAIGAGVIWLLSRRRTRAHI